MKQTTLRHYFLTSSIWTVIGKFIMALLGFLLSGILARLLTPDNMGLFFLSNSLAIFISLTGRFGLENTLLRMVSENFANNEKARVKSTIRKGIILVGIISSGVSLLVYSGPVTDLLTLLFNWPILTNYIGFIVTWAVLLSFQFLFTEIFRALKRINYSVIFGGTLTGIISISLLGSQLFAYGQINLITVYKITISAVFINIVVASFSLYMQLKPLPPNDEKRIIGSMELLYDSWPFWLNGITHYILGYSGLWILGAISSNTDVAYYGAADRVCLLIGMPLVIINSIVPPLIARWNIQGQYEQMERVLRGASTAAALPAIFIVIIILIFSVQIMAIIFGENYKASGHILQILSLGHLSSLLSGSCGYLLMMTKNQKIMMRIMILAAIMMVTLGIVFGSKYGAIGLAWSSTIVIIFQQLLTVIFARKYTGIWSCFSIYHLKQLVKKEIFGS